jgi:hypothetical protein
MNSYFYLLSLLDARRQSGFAIPDRVPESNVPKSKKAPGNAGAFRKSEKLWISTARRPGYPS